MKIIFPPQVSMQPEWNNSCWYIQEAYVISRPSKAVGSLNLTYEFMKFLFNEVDIHHLCCSCWGAHVARRLHSFQDAPPCGSSLSLHAFPCRRLASAAAKPFDPGRKWEGLGVLMPWGEVKDPSCSAANLAPIASAVLCEVMTSWDAESFAARGVECWKSSSEHDRVGVLQKAEQTKMFSCLIITLYHQKALLCRSHKGSVMT